MRLAGDSVLFSAGGCSATFAVLIAALVAATRRLLHRRRGTLRWLKPALLLFHLPLLTLRLLLGLALLALQLTLVLLLLPLLLTTLLLLCLLLHFALLALSLLLDLPLLLPLLAFLLLSALLLLSSFFGLTLAQIVFALALLLVPLRGVPFATRLH